MSSSSVQGQSELLSRFRVHAPDFPRFCREDGRIIFHDARVDRRLSNAQGVLQHTTEFTGVQAHPVMEHIFATSDSHGQVCLRDTRMAFGPLSARSNEGIVQDVRLSFTVHDFLPLTSFVRPGLKYVTKLSKRSLGYLSNPESSSITFDKDGRLFSYFKIDSQSHVCLRK